MRCLLPDGHLSHAPSTAPRGNPRIVDNHTIALNLVNVTRPVVAVLAEKGRPHGIEPVAEAAEIRYAGAEELPEALTGADVLFVWDFLSNAVPDAWHAADRLRWLHIASTGVDPVLFDGLVESDVTLTSSRGVFDDGIAEYVLGMVLAFAKDFRRNVELQARREWHHRETERAAGKNALVIGTGPIGRAIARLLRAAGLNVAGVGRRAREQDADFGPVHASDTLAEHVGWADYVVAIAPLTSQTKGMIDASVLAAMKPTARLINVGRGELVVTQDLVDALSAEEIAGAALDVVDPEPLPTDSPLWTMDDVLLTPHMSGDVVGWRDALVEIFVDNFQRYAAGEPLHNVVDKKLGYVPMSS